MIWGGGVGSLIENRKYCLATQKRKIDSIKEHAVMFVQSFNHGALRI